MIVSSPFDLDISKTGSLYFLESDTWVADAELNKFSISDFSFSNQYVELEISFWSLLQGLDELETRSFAFSFLILGCFNFFLDGDFIELLL
ncbi:23150_t:CDS:2 [Cetraspora pellucida]|uniref:23150_t:CDS:1 n=1 Tax=Cetraspora pellucida TaxID=1433469 RepID=A0A9N8ZAP5_9GLOM|nr:23150_t:CDS:2 [Cetraspora pellucida]